jgi:hypothetical protein
MSRHHWLPIVTLGFSMMLPACAPTSAVRWSTAPVKASLPTTGPVFVMDPLSTAPAFYRNSGEYGNPDIIQHAVGYRILEIVRELFPDGELVFEGRHMAMRLVPGYRAAGGLRVVTPTEYNAACYAYARGATHLLVPTIVEWQQARTDDPLGTFVAPHNRVIIDLRLMRLDSPTLVGQATFTNRSRLTFNQPADRLLNDDFRQTVRQLVSELPRTQRR